MLDIRSLNIRDLRNIPLDHKVLYGMEKLKSLQQMRYSCKPIGPFKSCVYDQNGNYTDLDTCIRECSVVVPSQRTSPTSTVLPGETRYSCQELVGFKFCGYDPNGKYTDYEQCFSECVKGIVTPSIPSTQPVVTQPIVTQPTVTQPTVTQPTGTQPTVIQPTDEIRFLCKELVPGVKTCVFDPQGNYTDLAACMAECSGITIPTGTQPTGTEPTGTEPSETLPTGTGTQPTGTQPTGTEPTVTEPTGTEPSETQPTGTQPTDGIRFSCKELVPGVKTCVFDSQGDYTDLGECMAECSGITTPTGTQPTGTQPTGTEPTGSGTQPKPICESKDISIAGKCINKYYLYGGIGATIIGGLGYYIYDRYYKE